MSISAMKQALEALEGNCTNPVADPEQAKKEDEAISALRQAIAEAEKQEPVAFRNTETGEFCTGGFLRKDWAKWQPLYAAPVHASDMSEKHGDFLTNDRHEFFCPRCGHCCKEWVGLTNEEVHDAFNFVEFVKQVSFDRDRPEWCENFAAYLEAKLK